MKARWALFILLAIPLMAQDPGCALEAQFTAAELQEIIDQLEGIQEINNALDFAARYVEENPSKIGEFDDLVDATTVARRIHYRGILALLDGPYDDVSTGTSHTQARATVISEGKALITGSTYTTARAHLQTMIDNCVSGCSNLTTAASEFDNGITARSGFDDTLGYLEPRLTINLSLPGASRTTSATAGPHGDYVYFIKQLLNNQERDNKATLERAVDAILLQEPTTEQAEHLYDAIFHNKLIENHILWATGLLIGAEVSSIASSQSIADHVEEMTAGGTTARGREFFQILLVIEMMINRVDTQTPADVEDVNGRTIIRGSTYDFTRVCQEYSRMIRESDWGSTKVSDTVDDTAFTPTSTQIESSTVASIGSLTDSRAIVFLDGARAGEHGIISAYSEVSGRARYTFSALTGAPADGDAFVVMPFVRPDWMVELAWANENNCTAWRDMDDGVFQGTLLLKDFQVFPPPPESGNFLCGTGTSEVGPECVADIQACGPGTVLVGTTCELE